MKLVQVYEHKKVKINDDFKDMLKIAYVTYAEVKDNVAILNDPKGKVVKKISKDMKDIKDEDYIYEETNVKLISFGDDSLTEAEVLEKAKNLLLGMYYEIHSDNGIFVCMKEIFDETAQKGYERSVVPSLNKQFESLISNMGESQSFTLNANFTSQLLGQTNSLELQDSNAYKSLRDYDIKGMYRKLKEIVFGQDKQLKVFLANTIKNISLSYSDLDVETIKRLKNNILLVGPTSTGKTLMVESLANILDVPYIICDAKRYTSNGYIGEDVESILIDLYRKYSEDPEKVQHGIVFIDEVDKLCIVKDEKSHVTTTDVQESLLKILDGTTINKTVRKGLTEEHLTFDTSKMTFVLSGAFTKIFEAENEITKDSLIKYGMIPELVGRLKTKIILNKPTKEDLKNALINGKYSYLNLFNTYLEMLNIDYEISNDFIDYVVDLAFEMNLGYNGLGIAISNYIDEYLYDLMSGDIQKLVYQKKK